MRVPCQQEAGVLSLPGSTGDCTEKIQTNTAHCQASLLMTLHSAAHFHSRLPDSVMIILDKNNLLQKMLKKSLSRRANEIN